jgi:hypothetical protein
MGMTKDKILTILRDPKTKIRLLEAERRAKETIDYIRDASQIDWERFKNWRVTI